MKIKRIGPDVGKQWLLKSKWYLKRMFGCFGDNAEVRKGSYLVHTDHIALGNNVVVRPGSHIYADAFTFITINRDVLLSPNVHIYTNNHVIKDGPEAYDRADVHLKPGCWIGAGAILLAGTVVGEGAVVGAGSVVTGNHIPDGEIWAGNPAKKIGEVDVGIGRTTDAVEILNNRYSEREPDEIQGQEVAVHYSRSGKLQRRQRQEHKDIIWTTPDILGDQSS